jgi:hypothetical protein
LGCIGALKLNERLLNMYWLLLLFLLFGDALIGIVWIFRFDKMYTDLKPILKQRLQMEYGVNEEFTNIWDHIQHDFQCCGVEGPQDFNDIDLTRRNLAKSDSKKVNNDSVENRVSFIEKPDENDKNRVLTNRTLNPLDYSYSPNYQTKEFTSETTIPDENVTETVKDVDGYTNWLLSNIVTMSSSSNDFIIKDPNVKYVHNVPESCCRILKETVPDEKQIEEVEETENKPTTIRQRLLKKKKGSSDNNNNNTVKRSVNSKSSDSSLRTKEEIRHQKSKFDYRHNTTPPDIVCEEATPLKKCKNVPNKRHTLDSKLQFRNSHVRHDSSYRNTHHYSISTNTITQNITHDKKTKEPRFTTGNVRIMDTCANVNGYSVGTIYGEAETLHFSVGCEIKLKKWLRDSAHVLGVLGYCVLAFLKLCFLGILRYEIREMIQKIKMLQGELQPPILLFSAESPNENPEVNSPTSPHNLCNHMDNTILMTNLSKNHNAISSESSIKQNPDRIRANSVGNAFLLLQPPESNQTTPVHQIKTIQMTQQNHRLFNNILSNDTGNESDTNSHCALLIDRDEVVPPPKKQHTRAPSNGNNNYESHELQELLVRHSAQI